MRKSTPPFEANTAFECATNLTNKAFSAYTIASIMMRDDHYYSSKLSAEKLMMCYEIAPPRIKQYLESEIQHVIDRVGSNDLVIELGCGYGRVLNVLSEECRLLFGIDISLDSIMFAKDQLGSKCNMHLAQMTAGRLGLSDNSVDAVVCIQNGISAFHLSPLELAQESLRIVKPYGICLFSSYSDKFWDSRLEWFELQSQRGLIGEIDWSKTGNGSIVCKDGFEASTFRSQDFMSLADRLGVDSNITEVDNSSIFWEIKCN